FRPYRNSRVYKAVSIIIYTLFDFFLASTMAVQSSTVMAIGMVQAVCLLAFKEAKVIFACSGTGVTIWIASTSSLLVTSSKWVKHKSSSRLNLFLSSLRVFSFLVQIPTALMFGCA